MFTTSNRDHGRIVTTAKTLGLIIATGLSLACTPASNATSAESSDTRSVQARTMVIQLTTVTDHYEAPGTVKARTQTILSSKVVGQITSLAIREGDRVRQGQVLAEIEGRDIMAQQRRAQAAEAEAQHTVEEVDGAIRSAEAAVRAAAANRDLALATQKRYDILRERRSVSPQEFDEVDARYKAAKAELERAQEMLAEARARRLQVLARIQQAEAEVEAAQVAISYLKIVSPINGVVTAKKVETGMLATPGAPLIALDDDSAYQVESIVDESRISVVHPGQPVRVEIDALKASVESRVNEIVPAADPTTRTYTVKLDLTLTPALRRNIHSGLFARALFPSKDRQVLLVPESALVPRGQLTGVYIVQNGAALLRLVKTGKRYEQGVEILSGLNSGDRVVVASHAGLVDGAKIIEEAAGIAP